jgi:DNA-binding MarR family transcriptional regulator
MARQCSVSELVGRLVANGLVLRRTDSNDARQVHLHLTAKGKKTVAGSEPTIQERLIAGIEKMSVTKRRMLADALHEWLEDAGLEDTPPTMFFEKPNG